MKRIVCIKGSLNKNSKTSIVMDKVIKTLENKKVVVDIIDIRDLNMEFCDGRPTEEYNSDMQSALKTIKKSDAGIIGMPVYQYSVAGPLKNFLDITTEAFNYKFIGIVSNSGGVRSYLAANDLMKILAFEAFALPIMPLVHTWAGDFEDDKLKNKKVVEKIDEMVKALLDRLK